MWGCERVMQLSGWVAAAWCLAWSSSVFLDKAKGSGTKLLRLATNI